MACTRDGICPPCQRGPVPRAAARSALHAATARRQRASISASGIEALMGTEAPCLRPRCSTLAIKRAPPESVCRQSKRTPGYPQNSALRRRSRTSRWGNQPASLAARLRRVSSLQASRRLAAVSAPPKLRVPITRCRNATVQQADTRLRVIPVGTVCVTPSGVVTSRVRMFPRGYPIGWRCRARTCDLPLVGRAFYRWTKRQYWWSRWESNPRSLACKASAFSLGYGPKTLVKSRRTAAGRRRRADRNWSGSSPSRQWCRRRRQSPSRHRRRGDRVHRDACP